MRRRQRQQTNQPADEQDEKRRDSQTKKWDNTAERETETENFNILLAGARVFQIVTLLGEAFSGTVGSVASLPSFHRLTERFTNRKKGQNNAKTDERPGGGSEAI